MKITYYGHACFGVQIGDKHLLFDPYIRPNELAKEIQVESIPANYILVSHGHFDHVQDALEIAKRTDATIVSNVEIEHWFKKQGVKNGHPMNFGGKWKFDFGTVKFVQAVHSSVLPDGTYGGNPGGFVVDSPEGKFYYSGDTALTTDMQLIPMSCGKLDVALLPIGDNFTMGIDDAILASDFIKCNRIIGLHFDTFGYIKIDQAEAVRKFKEKGKELILLKIGETVDTATLQMQAQHG